MERTPNQANLDAILARLDVLTEQTAYLVARQRRHEELLAELAPILREVVATATTRLDALDKQGYFAFGQELLGVLEKVVAGYQPEDVRRLGDAVVSILDTVRGLTQPEVLAIAGEAAHVLQHADAAPPLGLVGMVRATRTDDVQKGLSVMLEVLRHVGRGATALAEARQGHEKGRRALDSLAPRRRRGAPSGERASTRPSGAPRPAAPPSGAEVSAILDGYGFSADGHLADPSTWTRILADSLAVAQGVTLTDPHWRVIDLARADFEARGVAPGVRRLARITALSTRDLFALFPRAPARTIAKIAGIPRPAGDL
jgi:tRNA 2-thiouridine synthesizing protein E